MRSWPAGRPVGVVLVVALLWLYGVATVVAGLGLLWWRDEPIAQLPVLLARVDDALPFADWQDWQYVAAAGLLLVVAGIVVIVCADQLRRGSRAAYVALVVLSAALVAVSALALPRINDDLLGWGIDGLLALSAAVLVALLLLLASGRVRRVLGGSR